MFTASSALRVRGVVAALSAAAVIAGCGSSSSSTTATTSASGAGSGGALVLSTAQGTDGTYLTGASGRAVYLWLGDSGATSKCSGSCATSWPPVIAASAPKTSGAAVAADLGTTKRSDGSMQVTYKGHPLYYFAGDGQAGMTNGQGSTGFGARWWLVSPAGVAITKSASSSGGGGY